MAWWKNQEDRTKEEENLTEKEGMMKRNENDF